MCVVLPLLLSYVPTVHNENYPLAAVCTNWMLDELSKNNYVETSFVKMTQVKYCDVFYTFEFSHGDIFQKFHAFRPRIAYFVSESSSYDGVKFQVSLRVLVTSVLLQWN